MYCCWKNGLSRAISPRNRGICGQQTISNSYQRNARPKDEKPDRLTFEDLTTIRCLSPKRTLPATPTRLKLPAAIIWPMNRRTLRAERKFHTLRVYGISTSLSSAKAGCGGRCGTPCKATHAVYHRLPCSLTHKLEEQKGEEPLTLLKNIAPVWAGDGVLPESGIPVAAPAGQFSVKISGQDIQ